ncbi:MAG: zinc metalloprotease, partial [Bacteroidetes bacterium]|nr:zinc metalloprotease [Bacteroidota bacterium]
MKYFLPFVGFMLITLPGWTQRDCRSFDYRQQQLNADPSLAEKVEALEQFAHMRLQRSSVTITGEGTKETIPAVISIPVVVHIIYNISSQNISDAQVQSQLDVLNADYGKHNADTSLIPSYYTGLAADCGFRFVLAGVDTNGRATTGIVRKQTSAVSFALNDDVKFSARGGDDAWDRDRYLNVWVCNLMGNVLGYSSVVGGPPSTDGVVIKYTAFGTKGTALSPYNRGRTATHEIGHWLNLIHVWGDSPCGDDQVGDTPPQQQATYGDPSGIVISCNNAPYGN